MTDQQVLERRKIVTNALFKQYDTEGVGELTPIQLQSVHANLRHGGISLAQIRAAMDYCCITDVCEPSELFSMLQEMDRRYFLLKDFRWEFSILDRNQQDFITEDQARFMLEAVHGKLFSKYRWEKFVKSRLVPGSGVSFTEIEVDLCNIPSQEDLANTENEERRQKEERAKQNEKKKQAEDKARRERLAKMEAERLAKEEEDRKKKAKKKEDEDQLMKEREEDQRRKQEEALGKKEADDREKEEEKRRRLKLEELERERQRELEIIEVQQALEAQKELERKARELEEQEKKEQEMAKNVEEEAELAAAREIEAEEEAKRAKEAIKNATDAASKKAAEEAEKTAKEKAKRERNDRIRKDLKVAIKKKDRTLLNKSVSEFKKAKLADTEGDLHKAERILTQMKAKENLIKAMELRNLEELEKAINFVKKNSMEAHMPQEMIRANKLLLNLKRLKRLKDEILNLKQSTVAEIRSYNKPPRAVHMVMIGTYLLLGNKENTLKDWKGMQALVGKTGKEGLKRHVLQCDPSKIPLSTARRANELLKEFDLEQVRGVSAGAAVFFAWSFATIEEVEDIERQKQEGIEPTTHKGGPKTLKHELQSGKLTITI
ncbi:reticulocyte-binding protein 2 homolog a-like [Asterias rubens]|uniref:reticulocyte-binding protein 2 homolog a-like n=1 Tax=Asterias rubens TaxID=7604 RepID=UPI001455B5F9|nr:reticulocyte-binding protein 2 homolog a-like [Asterias rubens]